MCFSYDVYYSNFISYYFLFPEVLFHSRVTAAVVSEACPATTDCIGCIVVVISKSENNTNYLKIAWSK